MLPFRDLERLSRRIYFTFDAVGELPRGDRIGLREREFVRQPLDPVELRSQGDIFD